jgi:hypothetical protein
MDCRDPEAMDGNAKYCYLLSGTLAWLFYIPVPWIPASGASSLLARRTSTILGGRPCWNDEAEINVVNISIRI